MALYRFLFIQRSLLLVLATLTTCIIFVFAFSKLGNNNSSYFSSLDMRSLRILLYQDQAARSDEAAAEMSKGQAVDPTEIGRTLRSRQSRIAETCRGNYSYFTVGRPGVSRLQTRLYRNDDYKMLYCGIEKIGSSFWKRIFKVLDKINTTKVHLFDMPSMSAHLGIPKRMSMRNVSENKLKSMLATYTSFMFTRDPFARFFSGYIDKMVLPNALGSGHGKVIAHQLRRKVPKLCSLNVTFDMMSDYVASNILNNVSMDGHFSPTFEHCTPCHINYTYVGKMESFMDDTKYILESVGLTLSNIIGEDKGRQTDEMNEKGIIEDLAHRTFDFVDHKSHICLEKKDVIARLWRVYQIRGIISKTVKLPAFHNLDRLSVDRFVSEAWKVYDRSTTPREERLKQRGEALQEAFSSLPELLLDKLSRAFAQDCKLFDYDCDVTKRFPANRQSEFSFLKFLPEDV